MKDTLKGTERFRILCEFVIFLLPAFKNFIVTHGLFVNIWLWYIASGMQSVFYRKKSNFKSTLCENFARFKF